MQWKKQPNYFYKHMNEEDRTAALKQIKEEVLNLKDSPLVAERMANKVFPVIGEGSHSAKIMFIGEAPGKNEAATGRPFCGTSGKILDALLGSVGLERRDIYITNIVKDRPPQNRDPLPDEIVAYGPFLNRQIDIIQPKVIATLGRFSMDYIMRQFGLEFEILPISQAHGKIWTGKTSYGTVTIIPLYHPAASIYNQHLKETLQEDFKIMKEYANK
jgi:uracil-DNA glycosylase family 4